MKYVGAWGAGYANYGATLTTIKGQVEGGVTYTQTMDFAWPITPSVVRAKDAWYQGAENFDTLINQLDALVAGVCLSLHASSWIGMKLIAALSVDGQCKTFDASADGFGRSEACGAVMVKRMSA